MFIFESDISDQKEEEKLLDTKELYRSLFKNSNDVILITSPDGTVYAANSEACRIFGMTEEEIICVGRSGVVDASDPRLKPALEERIRTGEFKGELNFRRKDGTIFPGEISTKLFTVKNGVVKNVMIIRDITERKQVEEKLLESEYKYSLLFDKSTVAVALFRLPEVIFVDVNMELEKLVGFTRQEIIGKTTLELGIFRPEIRKQVIAKYLNEGSLNGVVTHIFTKSGEERIIQVNSNSLEMNGQRYVLSSIMDITENKIAEEALLKVNERLEEKVRERTAELEKANISLKESEEKYRNLIETANEGISLISNEGVITYVNKKMSDLLEYTVEEIVGKTIWDFVEEEVKPIITSNFEKRCYGINESYELRLIRKDGSPLWLIANVKTLFDKNGMYLGTLNLHTDISERKKAEAKLKQTLDNLEIKVKERTLELNEAYELLKEREGRLAEAQEVAHIGNWERNFETNRIHWSDELYRIFGFKPQEFEIIPELFLKYVHPDYQNYVNKAFKGAFNGTPFSIDHRVTISNGEERIVHAKGEVVFDENNNPVRIRGTVQDITERKQSEEKLRDSEEKYRNIVETANEGIVIINDLFNVTYVNQKMVDMLGYRLEEGIGKSIWDFISEESIDIVKSNFKQRSQGKNGNYELKLRRKDGSTSWVFANAKSLFDKDGRFMGSLSMLTDITKRKEAEEELKNIEIARKKEIHHRIKNNLQVISSLLDLQADKFNHRECIHYSEVMEAFRESQDRVISMALIHEELYKGEGLEKLNFSPYVEELAENLLQTYSIGNTAISLKLNLENNVFFDMDIAVPLGMIINELVSNSFKHAFQGSKEGEIQIKLYREKSGAYISAVYENLKSETFALAISDNGVGIPANLDIEELDSLGLQLVTSLVAQLNGEIELKRNNGTKFTIRFTVTDKNNLASASAPKFIDKKTAY